VIDEKRVKNLKSKARECRRILMSTPFTHFGGCLSVMDITTALYFYKMKIDPKNPEWEERDRLVLSKAHCVGALYPALGLLGYFPKEKWFPLYGGSPVASDGWTSIFGMHNDRWRTPGIDFSGGSLAQGLGFAAGMAWAALLKAPKDPLTNAPVPGYKVYCITGDGESNEGLIWESAMFAGRHKLFNLVNIVDYNNYNMSEEMGPFMEPIVEKWRAFGWYVIEIDGHDMHDICHCLDMLDAVPEKPKCVIAHTIKGKGVPMFEEGHTHTGSATPEQVKEALETYLAPLPEE
jgi:transketolase